MLQRVAVCCSVLQRGAVCCSVLQCRECCRGVNSLNPIVVLHSVTARYNMLQSVAVFSQCVAVGCRFDTKYTRKYLYTTYRKISQIHTVLQDFAV